eukprot:185205-Chlamydomonas_euryale.AAC.1
MSSDEERRLKGSRNRKQTESGFCQIVCGARWNAMELLRRSKGAAWYWNQFNVVQGEDLKVSFSASSAMTSLTRPTLLTS